MSADPENAENQEKAQKALDELLKEMRVRFGTIIKTDNVSFLLGAGASLAVGGVSLANIPKPIEKALIDKAKDEQKGKEAPAWIERFYMIASALSRKDFSFDSRAKLFQSTEENDIPPIERNLEDFFSQLHAWHAGMLDTTETLKLTGGSELVIRKNDLADLIKNITISLTVLLNLPKSGLDDPLRSHRKFIKKILTRPLNLRRVNLFTLNYDTLIEQAGDAVGAVLVDGFCGRTAPRLQARVLRHRFLFPNTNYGGACSPI